MTYSKCIWFSFGTQFINVSQNLNSVSLLLASHSLSMASHLTTHAHNSTHSPPVGLLLPQIWFCCGSTELSAEIWATLHCFSWSTQWRISWHRCMPPYPKVFLCFYCSNGWEKKRSTRIRNRHINCWDEGKKRSLGVSNFEKCGWRVNSVMEGDGGKRANSGCLKWAGTWQTSCNWLQEALSQSGLSKPRLGSLLRVAGHNLTKRVTWE